MADTPYLLECPFCGEKPRGVFMVTIYSIVCESKLCPANPRVYSDTKDRVVTNWNRRH